MTWISLLGLILFFLTPQIYAGAPPDNIQLFGDDNDYDWDTMTPLNEYEIFMEWFRQHCSDEFLVNFDANPDTGRRGLFLTQTVDPGTVLLSVPVKCMMSSETAKESDLFIITQRHPDITWIELLPLFLLYEKSNPNSFWSPYFAILPEYVDLPIFWDDSDLEELQSSRLISITKLRRAKLNERYENEVKPYLQEFGAILEEDAFSFANFSWAMSIIESRSVPLHPELDNPPEPVLAPFFDGFNHEIGADWQLKKNKHSLHGEVKTANRVFSKGEEFFIDYGPPGSPSIPNLNLLSKMGFTLYPHPVDSMYVAPDSLPACCLPGIDTADTCDERTRLLKARSLSERMFALRYGKLDNNIRTWAFTCYVNMDGECDLPEFGLPDQDSPQCRETRIMTAQKLQNQLISTLNSYPTTLEEDVEFYEAALESGKDLGSRFEQAIRLRISEKKMLTANIEFLQDEIDENFELIEKDGWTEPESYRPIRKEESWTLNKFHGNVNDENEIDDEL